MKLCWDSLSPQSRSHQKEVTKNAGEEETEGRPLYTSRNVNSFWHYGDLDLPYAPAIVFLCIYSKDLKSTYHRESYVTETL